MPPALGGGTRLWLDVLTSNVIDDSIERHLTRLIGRTTLERPQYMVGQYSVAHLLALPCRIIRGAGEEAAVVGRQAHFTNLIERIHRYPAKLRVIGPAEIEIRTRVTSIKDEE